MDVTCIGVDWSLARANSSQLSIMLCPEKHLSCSLQGPSAKKTRLHTWAYAIPLVILGVGDTIVVGMLQRSSGTRAPAFQASQTCSRHPSGPTPRRRWRSCCPLYEISIVTDRRGSSRFANSTARRRNAIPRARIRGTRRFTSPQPSCWAASSPQAPGLEHALICIICFSSDFRADCDLYCFVVPDCLCRRRRPGRWHVLSLPTRRPRIFCRRAGHVTGLVLATWAVSCAAAVERNNDLRARPGHGRGACSNVHERTSSLTCGADRCLAPYVKRMLL